MIGIDTNVLIRHLVQDDPGQSRAATHIMTKQCTRDDPGFINRIVLCEMVWVLESAYGKQGTRVFPSINTQLAPIIPRLSASVMEAQLSDHQSITLDAVHHAMFVGYSARPES